MRMIDKKSISFSQIKSDVENYLKSLDNWDDIKDNLPPSNLNIITDIIAGFGSYMVYKNHALRNETYLSSAKLESSIYGIARTFGYEIKRYTSPSIKLRYNEVPTIMINSGDILGTYNDYEIIYYGRSRLLEKLDTIDVYIGRYVKQEFLAEYVDGILRFKIEPESLKSIDDTKITLIESGIEHPISRDIEDYVINNKIVDYSLDPYSTELMCGDRNYSYGVSTIRQGSRLEINYIETDGRESSIDINDLDLDDKFIPLSVNHLGTNGQSIDQIKRLVPLFYSTQRRMVTAKDHQYVAESHQYIRSAYAERDDGRNQISILRLYSNVSQGDLVDFSINNRDYLITIESNNLLDATKEVADRIKHDPTIEILELDEEDVKIITRNPRFLDEFTIRSGNITQEITQKGIKPRCCTIHLYYVKYDVEDDPIELTYYEQLELSDYLNYYKMVGARIILIPADVIKKDLDLSIKLLDNKYFLEVELQVRELLKEYELTLGKEFSFGEFMSKVAQIKVFDEDGEVIYPVKSIVPINCDPTELDIPLTNNRYIKFDNVNINLS